ncbi:MAG TPA: S16 family serine protease, partial [Gemmatimonadaceae bacterium]|nr:S16 family serine protease [Gemmatimonadaceae bacterium]
VILPGSNEKDLRDIPDEVRSSMAFTFVSTMDEVLHLMLMQKPQPVLADSAAAAPPAPRKKEKASAPAGRTDDTASVAKS